MGDIQENSFSSTQKTALHTFQRAKKLQQLMLNFASSKRTKGKLRQLQSHQSRRAFKLVSHAPPTPFQKKPQPLSHQHKVRSRANLERVKMPRPQTRHTSRSALLLACFMHFADSVGSSEVIDLSPSCNGECSSPP